MDTIPINLQLMDTNCKPIHARAYTVPRSVEQQLQQSKEIVRLVDIGVLKEDYSSKCSSLFPSVAIPKKNGTIRVVTDFRELNLLLKRKVSPISYSKYWGHDPFNGRAFASALDLNMGYYCIKLDHDVDPQKLCTIIFPWGKYKYKRLPLGIKIAWFLMFFKTSCLSLSKIWNTLRPILMIC
jgi:hypothetical protein